MAKKPLVGGAIEDRTKFVQPESALANANMTFINRAHLRKRRLPSLPLTANFRALRCGFPVPWQIFGRF
ncbi:hypothetical protein [Nonomuraea sp. NPDC049400]|uniref:hypothetical protein n=1 Tax=Nonomuraea sp. NPDC049400 TaxID=3364352 RepID=UPI0037BA63AF